MKKHLFEVGLHMTSGAMASVAKVNGHRSPAGGRTKTPKQSPVTRTVTGDKP